MLLQDKYFPTDIENFGTKYAYLNNIKNISHTIVYGKPGSGKLTLTQLILRNIYGTKKTKISSKYISNLTMNNNKLIKLNVYHSCVHYIINPCLYGLYDKVILVNFLKDLTTNTDIKKYTGSETNKIVIIKNAESLSKNAQNALRSIIENNNNDFRLIFLCSSLNKISEPLISRCVLIKVSTSIDNTIKILENILSEENMTIDTKLLKRLVIGTKNNLKKSINLIDYYSSSLDMTKQNDKPMPLDDAVMDMYLQFDDTSIINKILVNYIYSKNLNNIVEMRNLIYNLSISFNKPMFIMDSIYRKIERDISILTHITENQKIQILMLVNEHISSITHMLSVANKPIIYFENFIYFMFEILDEYDINLHDESYIPIYKSYYVTAGGLNDEENDDDDDDDDDDDQES
jgi:DNA polymerase III delta prime subunit